MLVAAEHRAGARIRAGPSKEQVKARDVIGQQLAHEAQPRHPETVDHVARDPRELDLHARRHERHGRVPGRNCGQRQPTGIDQAPAPLRGDDLDAQGRMGDCAVDRRLRAERDDDQQGRHAGEHRCVDDLEAERVATLSWAGAPRAAHEQDQQSPRHQRKDADGVWNVDPFYVLVGMMGVGHSHLVALHVALAEL